MCNGAMPEFYDPRHCFDPTYSPDPSEIAASAAEWGRRHDIPQAAEDQETAVLAVVDGQHDFSFPQGALYVAGRSGTGAMDANRNLAEFIYRHAARLTRIDCTLDTDHPFQVFHPAAHLTAGGSHPAPFTIITAEEYRTGKYRANPAMARALGVEEEWLNQCWVSYCERLEKGGKYELCIWPYHCLLGSRGHSLAGCVLTAWLAHKHARGAADKLLVKGDSPFTEWYSIFEAEVLTTHDGAPIPGAETNVAYIRELLSFDRVIVAGLASSHCVRTSLECLAQWIAANDPSQAGKVYVLRDCTAPVVVPGADYTDEAEQAMERLRDVGMHVVDSSEVWS
jgi:nicotinamidase-related amidase